MKRGRLIQPVGQHRLQIGRAGWAVLGWHGGVGILRPLLVQVETAGLDGFRPNTVGFRAAFDGVEYLLYLEPICE